jgi:hypothetical protein
MNFKTILKEKGKAKSAFSLDAKSHYFEKYYNMFMSNTSKKLDNITYQQKHFLLQQYFFEGKICMFKLDKMEGLDKLIYVPFAPYDINIYDFPVHVTYINRRGVSWIPTGLKKVDEDCVIGYALESHRSIYSLLDYEIDRIVAAEILIGICEDTLKLPFLLAVTPEDKEKLNSVMDAILRGESKVYCDFNDINSLKVLTNSNPYILDKLMEYKRERENECKTLIGINNYTTQEKSQYINNATVESNNEEIEVSASAVIDSLKELSERAQEVLGISFTVKEDEVEEPEEAQDEEEEDEENEVQD